MLFVTCCVYRIAVAFTPAYRLTKFECTLIESVSSFGGLCSLYFICIASWQRYVGYAHPQQFHWIMKHNTLITMCVCCLVASITVWGILSANTEEKLYICSAGAAVSETVLNVMKVVGMIPSFGTVVINILLYRSVKRRIHENVGKHMDASYERDIRLSQSVLLVGGFYTSTWLPATLVYAFIQEVMMSPEKFAELFHNVINIIANTNGISNYFIFLGRSPEYRRAFFKVFKVKTGRQVEPHQNQPAALVKLTLVQMWF